MLPCTIRMPVHALGHVYTTKWCGGTGTRRMAPVASALPTNVICSGKASPELAIATLTCLLSNHQQAQ